MHNDFVIDFHQHAPASVPEGCLAVAVARAGAGEDVRQAQVAAGETNADKLVFWQLELSQHRLPVRAAKAQPFLLVSMLAWEQLKITAKATAAKNTFPAALIVLTTHSMVLTLSYSNEIASIEIAMAHHDCPALPVRSLPTNLARLMRCAPPCSTFTSGSRYNACMLGETICFYFFIAFSVSLLRQGPLNLIPTGRRT